jgi:hypothetical protein
VGPGAVVLGVVPPSFPEGKLGASLWRDRLQRRFPEFEAAFDRLLELARRLGDRTTVALALCGLARVALREDLDWARELWEEALEAVQDTDDTLGRSNALHVLGSPRRCEATCGRHATSCPSGSSSPGSLATSRRSAWSAPTDEGPHFERGRVAVEGALDRDQFERAWSAGQRMPSAHAVRYALTPRPSVPRRPGRRGA